MIYMEFFFSKIIFKSLHCFNQNWHNFMNQAQRLKMSTDGGVVMSKMMWLRRKYSFTLRISLFLTSIQVYSEESNSEPDVDLENQYYNSKSLKEDDPKAALESFQKVILQLKYLLQSMYNFVPLYLFYPVMEHRLPISSCEALTALWCPTSTASPISLKKPIGVHQPKTCIC